MTNQDTLALCGKTGNRKNYFHFEAYEFDIFDAHTGKSLVTYGAPESCQISASRDSIVITQTKRMPAGKDWTWVSKPVAVQRIVIKDNDLIVEPVETVMPEIDIGAAEIEELMAAVALLKDKGELINPYEITGRLFVAALAGHKEAARLLLSFRDEFNCTVDGAVAETWYEFKHLYEQRH